MTGRSRWLSAGLVVALCGCGSTVLAPADMAGTYQATNFSVVLGGVSTNILAAGASVTMVLTADGKTSGRIVVPVVAGVQVSAIDQDLAGTFKLINGYVQVNQASGGYLDGFIFTADPPELRGYITQLNGQLTLILRRQ
jgi:hypothetical protein